MPPWLDKLIQCLSDSKILTYALWAAGGTLVSVAVSAGLFVRWILKERIDYLKDRLERAERERSNNVSIPGRYSFKQLIVAVLLTTVFATGLAGSGLFLYYNARLRSTEGELHNFAVENQRSKALLHPLVVTFGEDKILHWPSEIEPKSAQTLNKSLVSPILIMDASGAAYSARASSVATLLRVGVKEERTQTGQGNQHQP
jgi:hypothetical protein